MAELPKRKQLRLQQFDYSTPGAYFVTICTQDRKCILSDITVGADALGGPELALTATGKIVEKMFCPPATLTACTLTNTSSCRTIFI